MLRTPDHSIPLPVYAQVAEQIRLAMMEGSLAAGDKLPSIRKLARTLEVDPNTIRKIYYLLRREGVIEIRHGIGVFVAHSVKNIDSKAYSRAQRSVRDIIERLRNQGFLDDEIRLLIESELVNNKQHAR